MRFDVHASLLLALLFCQQLPSTLEKQATTSANSCLINSDASVQWLSPALWLAHKVINSGLS